MAKKDNKNVKKDLSNCDCEKLEKQVGDLTNQLKRALADYQNLKKRVEGEKKILTLTANLALIDSVLDIVGDMDLAIEKYTKTEADEAEWLSGIKLIYNKVTLLLENQSVVAIEVKEGDEFDPEYHEAIGTVTVKEKGKENRIVGITRKGYMVGDNVLRPVRVIVGKFEKS